MAAMIIPIAVMAVPVGAIHIVTVPLATVAVLAPPTHSPDKPPG